MKYVHLNADERLTYSHPKSLFVTKIFVAWFDDILRNSRAFERSLSGKLRSDRPGAKLLSRYPKRGESP